MAADAAVILARVRRLLDPPRRVELREWTDKHRRLSSEASASAGPWRTLTFQREPLNAIAPGSPWQTVVFVWASQMGKSELLLNLITYAIAVEPGPMLVVQPTLMMVEAFSKDRIAPLLRDTPILRGKVADPKSRDAGSTIYPRRFTGGHLTLVGSNSPSGLASRPVRYLLLDECDRYETSAGAEGDP
jgi:phage terminase large subunit GpA-like protein